MRLISFLSIVMLLSTSTASIGNIINVMGNFVRVAHAAFKTAQNVSSNASGLLNTSNTGNVGVIEDISASGLKPKNLRWKKVQAGAEAVSAITNAIASDTYSGNFGVIGVIAKKFAPFLGAIGPFLNLITMFIPAGPSPELQLMLREFSRINARFDQVFARFDELESKIVEKALKSQYGKYQSEITALSLLLNDFLKVATDESSNSIKESRKKKFLEAYESSDKTATLKLWQGMMSDRALVDNIPENVAKYTFNNRLLTQNFMKRVLHSIIQGVNVMVYRYQMIGDNDTSIDQQAIWIDRIVRLTAQMEVVDLRVKFRYHDQAQKDTDKLLAKKFGASNKDFADFLYQFLSKKFDWRNWLVVVYNPLHGGHLHWVQYCGGFKRFRTHGRNTVVATNYKSSRMDRNSVQKKLIAVPQERDTRTKWWWKHRTKHIFYDAHTIFDHIPSDMSRWCNYPGLGVIEMNADIHYRAPKDHLVVVKKRRLRCCQEGHDFKIHAFR